MSTASTKYMNLWQGDNGRQWVGTMFSRDMCDHAAGIIAAERTDIRRIAIIRVHMKETVQ